METKTRLSASLILPTALVVAGCFFVTHDEVARVTSPDGRIDAVTVESNGGATTSFWYDIYLERRGWIYRPRVHVAHLYGAVRSKTAYGANVRWTSPRSVVVEYLSAQSADLILEQAEMAGQSISVALRPDVSDPLAPSGGMLYNLGD